MIKIKSRSSFLILCSVISITSNLFGQLSNDESIQELDLIFQRDIPENAPGAAVAILKDGKLIYERYEGYRDLKKKSRIDQNARFNIASNGKQFTALAILLLEEDGKLNLSDDIRKYLPNLYKNIEESITIKHLLTHTSGIRDVYDLWSLKGLTWWEEKLSNSDAINLLVKQKELNFKPGSAYLYSNSNYILLAEIVSVAAGKDFIAFTDDMFKNLKMKNTSFVDNYKKIEPPIAKPYFNFDKWFNYDWTCNIHGDGNLFSSMKDQIVWERIIQNGSNDFLSTDIIDQSQNLLPNFQNYGYGLEFGTYKGIEYRFHEGSTGAWKATTIRFKNPELTVITLTNSGKITTDMQSRNMVDVLLNKKKAVQEIKLEPDIIGTFVTMPQIIGAYALGTKDIFRFEERDGELFLLRHGRNDTKLVRENDNIFHQWNDSTFKQEFIVNDDGSVKVTFYHTTHQPYSLKKELGDWNDFEFNSLNGQYVNSETGVEFFLTYISDKTYKLKFGKQAFEGILVTPEKLFVDGYIARFNPTNTDILLNGNRIKNIRFEKSK